jgi:hypothetical protein
VPQGRLLIAIRPMAFLVTLEVSCRHGTQAPEPAVADRARSMVE